MSPKDRYIVSVGVLAGVMAAAFPPWAYRYGASAGYHLIFLAPQGQAHIDMGRLAVECAAIAGVSFVARLIAN